MKNLIYPISIGIASLSFALSPAPAAAPAATVPLHMVSVFPEESIARKLYAELDLQAHGLSPDAFERAWTGYAHFLEKGQIRRPGLLSICDFSQPSSKKRLYIIDMEQRRMLRQTYVAHGRNSGTVYATRFSNRDESWQSSLGFYATGASYTGSHGLSLRLHGLEPGINDRAAARAIVLHGAGYVDPSRARSGVMMGRSLGCPAVPQQEAPAIVQQIREGSCFFVYHPAPAYLQTSTIFND